MILLISGAHHPVTVMIQQTLLNQQHITITKHIYNVY